MPCTRLGQSSPAAALDQHVGGRCRPRKQRTPWGTNVPESLPFAAPKLHLRVLLSPRLQVPTLSALRAAARGRGRGREGTEPGTEPLLGTRGHGSVPTHPRLWLRLPRGPAHMALSCGRPRIHLNAAVEPCGQGRVRGGTPGTLWKDVRAPRGGAGSGESWEGSPEPLPGCGQTPPRKGLPGSSLDPEDSQHWHADGQFPCPRHRLVNSLWARAARDLGLATPWALVESVSS